MYEKELLSSRLKKTAVTRLVQDTPESPSNNQASTATSVLVQRARLDPHSLSSSDVLQLQRTIGNRAVGQLINREVTDLIKKFDGTSNTSSGTTDKAPVVTGGKSSISQLAQKFSGSPTSTTTTSKAPIETGKRSVTQLAQKFGGTPTGATNQPKVGKLTVSDEMQEKLSSVFEGSKLRSSHKRGQNLVEEVVHGSDKLFDKDGEFDESVANTPVTSEQIMRLVTLNNFNKIARKDPRSMSDEEKFTVIKANQMMSQEVKKGLKINKIIPEWQVNKRLGNTMGFTDKSSNKFINTSNTFGGSVATEKNYAGITGSESVANFGLDYGSYQDQTTKQPVTASGGISPYLPEKSAFTGKYKTVQRTYFIKVELPDDKIQDIKVPVAQELIDFANQIIVASTQVLSDQSADKEIKQKAQEKIAICQQFLAVAAAGLVNFTRNVDGSKNTEDPLNETGMTTKGSRVMEIIGPEGLTTDDYRTINQEYYLKGFLSFPQGTTMWVKTEKGEDIMVAQLSDVQTPKWDILRQDLLPTV